MDSKNFKVHDEILLLDSTITKKELKTINKNYKKIITFDIISDRLLTANKISHITSDDFLNISITKLFNNWSNKMLNIINDLTVLSTKTQEFEKYFC